MKKKEPNRTILFLLVILLLTGTVNGQTYFSESFDSETFPPTGWTQTQVSGTGLWERWETGNFPSCSPYSGAGMAGYRSVSYPTNTSAVLVSPAVDLSGTENLRLQFWMYRDNGITSALDVVDYYINTSASLTNAQLLGTINRPITAEPVESVSGWYMYEFDIPATYNGSENYILLKATSKYGMNMFVDEVRIYLPEAANNPPVNFLTEAISQTGMTIKWTDNSTNEAGFKVYISTDDINYSQYGNDIASTTQAETGTEYSQEITDLLPGTTYYFKISAYYELESDYLTGNQTTLEAGQIVSTASGNWNNEATWSSGTIPTISDNVLIETGHTVTLNTAGYFNNLTTNGTLAMQSYTLSGTNVDITETGIINVTSGTNANLSVTGNITNNGTMDFYSSDVIVGRITFTGTNAQTFNANSTTNLGFVVVNKGISHNNIVEIVANGTFGIKNGSTANFLTLTNGTIKISGTASVSNNVFPSIGYTIGSTCGFWLNNPNFEVLGQNAPTTVDGLLRISNGIYNVGNTANNSLSAGQGSTFIIEGGTLNLASRFYAANAISFSLLSGTINVNLFGNSEPTASFGLVSSGNSINISGGTINLVKPSEAVTPKDYSVSGSSPNITGGILQAGTEATSSPYEFRIQGNTPNLVIDNTTNTKSVLLSAATNIYGDITINAGAILNTKSYTIQLIGNPSNTGNIQNDGLITNTSSTGSNLLTFIGAHGSQNLTGTGTIGDATTPFAGVAISNPSGVTLNSTLVINRVNLLNGILSGSNNITLGNGAGSFPLVQKGGNSSYIAGSFDQAPTISTESTYNIVYSTALEPFTTGFELPDILTGTLEISSNVDVTFGKQATVGKLSFSSSNTGNLITTEFFYPTISGTQTTDLIINSGNSGFLKGPMALTLPNSLEAGQTYLFPIKKSENCFLELVNPTTSAGGNVVIKAEVFDENSGGTAGTNIQEGSLQNRYWKTEIISGAENFTNTAVRVTQDNPTLTTESGLAESSTLAGVYDLVSTDQPDGNSILSNVITELGYFAIGVKQVSQVYQSSNTTQPDLSIVMTGETDQLILEIEIVTSGNSPALQVSNIDFSTNGSSDLTDIASAKLFYTGTSSTFSTDVQVGATISSPGSTFSINPSQDLLEGTNYFWLVYDISENATDKNTVDAECTSITAGGVPYNPSVSAPAGSRIIRSFLSGTYLVGASGDYTTITEAIADLNLVGVSAPVNFMLSDENYSTAEVFPITVNEILNSNQDNFVTIKPSAGITPEIIGDSDNPIFVINTNNFGIDGSNTVEGATRDLTITNNGTGASSGIILSNNGLENLSFRNLIGIGGASSAGYGITLDGVSNSEVLNCNISKLLYGIQAKGNSSQINISNNEIGSTISENKIHTNAISVENTSNFSVNNNRIIGVESGTTATSSGIKISGASINGNITGNEIRDIKNTLLPGYGSNGIWVNSSNTSSNIKVFNNVISDIASYGYSDWDVGRNGYGIVITNGGGYGIYYNTIHLNTNQTSTNSRTAGLNISSTITAASSLDVRNNIIVNSQTIGTRYAVYCGASKTVFTNINYNNYHAPTAIGFITFVRTTLTNWQTGTGKDANSLNLLPYFTSDTDLRLINNMNCPLDGVGTPIAEVTTDFDDVTRDASFPDLGAFEFTTVPFAAPAAEFDEVCYGSPSGLLTLSDYSGTIVRWESSVSPFTEWTEIAHLLETYTSDPLEENTLFRVILDYGLCNEFATESVEVAVSPTTVGGAVSGGTEICYGQTSELLSLSGHVGDVVRWESSVSPFDTWTTIENTQTTYTSEALTDTTRFRAVVKSGVCDEQNSDYTEVAVLPLSVGGSVSGGTTICSGSTSSELTLSGNVGDVVRWEFSENETDWIEIANTETSYTSEVLTQTTHFRAVVQSGPCSEATSEYTTVTVNPPSVGGAVSGGTSVCSGQTSELLTLTGHTGDVVRWESSVSPFDTWTTIDNTLETYTSGPLTEVTRFRAAVKSGVCDEAISDYTEVTISPPTVGGAVSGGTTICEGETSGVLTLSGYTGDIIKWQHSFNELDWIDIENTEETYTSDVLTQTTHFRAVVKSGGCEALESDFTTVTVNPLPDAAISTTSELTFCEGDVIDVLLTASPSDGTYTWFKNDIILDGESGETLQATTPGIYTVEVTVNGCSSISEGKEIVVNTLPDASISTNDALTYCEGDDVSVALTATPSDGTYRWFKGTEEISGATGNTFTVTSAGSYSVEVTVNGCSATSNEIEVVVNPLPVPTIATSDELTYCEGDEISVTFTVDIPDATYQWFIGEAPIDGETSSTLTTSSAGIYSVEVTVNGCSGVSNEMEIVVNPLPLPTISTSNALTYCEGDEISVEFTVDIADATYQWFIGETPIDGETSSTLTTSSAGIYSVEVTVNGCSGVSNEMEILVNPTPLPTISTENSLTYCSGDEIAIEFSVDISADVYQWFQYDSPIEGETNATFTATEAGLYSVGVIVNGCPGISNELEVVVNPLPETSLPTDTVYLSLTGSFTFDAGEGFASYLWFDESTEQTYLFDGETWGTGVFDIWVEVTNEYGCTLRDSAVVSVGTVGINTDTPWTMSIYPNPSSGKFFISLDGFNAEKVSVSVFNSVGQQIIRNDYKQIANKFIDFIDIGNNAKGVYIITVSDGKYSVTKKLIVK